MKQPKYIQKLQDCYLLGSVDFLFEEEKRQNRLEHSLEVARLSLLYAKIKKQDPKLYYYSGLLHDIGHSIFSHSMEIEDFGHDKLGELLCLGRFEILENDIPHVLEEKNIDVNEIFEIDKYLKKELYNPDRIEGIVRTISYLEKPKYTAEELLIEIYKNDNEKAKEYFTQKRRQIRAFFRRKEVAYLDNFVNNYFKQNKIELVLEDFLNPQIFKNKYQDLFIKLEEEGYRIRKNLNI